MWTSVRERDEGVPFIVYFAAFLFAYMFFLSISGFASYGLSEIYFFYQYNMRWKELE